MTATTILISGAGIAGPTLAFWLRASGFEPTIVERAPTLRSGGYVIDFWGRGYEIAEGMGLGQDLERVGYHIREFRVVDGEGRRVAGFGQSAFRALAGRRFITLRRSDLSRLVIEKARSGAEILFDDEIASLHERPDCVEVQFARAGRRLFDLVIGADGLHSKVRALAFGPEERFEKRLGYAVAAFETSGYRPRDEDAYVIYNEPRRMLGRVALRDDRTLFLFVFAEDESAMARAADREAQTALLRQTFAACGWECARVLAELDGASDLYFDAVSQIKLESWSRGRVALVGDAAFCVSLMAGQGSALAMTAAYVLAGELGKAGGRHEEAFRNYEARLREFVAMKQRGAERLSAAFAPKTQRGLLLRNLIINACAIPAVAKLAFSREISDTLPLPDYRWPALEPAAK